MKYTIPILAGLVMFVVGMMTAVTLDHWSAREKTSPRRAVTDVGRLNALARKDEYTVESVIGVEQSGRRVEVYAYARKALDKATCEKWAWTSNVWTGVLRFTFFSVDVPGGGIAWILEDFVTTNCKPLVMPWEEGRGR